MQANRHIFLFFSVSVFLYPDLIEKKLISFWEEIQKWNPSDSTGPTRPGLSNVPDKGVTGIQLLDNVSMGNVSKTFLLNWPQNRSEEPKNDWL